MRLVPSRSHTKSLQCWQVLAELVSRCPGLDISVVGGKVLKAEYGCCLAKLFVMLCSCWYRFGACPSMAGAKSEEGIGMIRHVIACLSGLEGEGWPGERVEQDTAI